MNFITFLRATSAIVPRRSLAAVRVPAALGDSLLPCLENALRDLGASAFDREGATAVAEVRGVRIGATVAGRVLDFHRVDKGDLVAYLTMLFENVLPRVRAELLGAARAGPP